MKSIQIDGDRLTWSDSEIHGPGPGEVGIAVRASAVNRADLLQRRGAYPPPPGASEVLGLECAGVVEAVGEGVAGLRPGDEVCALLAGGGYAERAVAPAPQVLPVPEGLSLVEAAALPEVFATAYLNLYMEAGLREGEKALLHAGASGVGTAAIQLCREFGNPCYVTAGSDDKIARCMALGRQRRQQPPPRALRRQGGRVDRGRGLRRHPRSGGRSLPGGQPGVPWSRRPPGAHRRHGRGSGHLLHRGGDGQAPEARGFDLADAQRRRKGEVLAELRRRVWPRIAAGAIRPVIEAVVSMDRAEEAHRLIAGNRTFGKVVLEVP